MQRTATKNIMGRLNDALELLRTECNVNENDIMGVTVLDTGYMCLRLSHDAYLNVLIHDDARAVSITSGEGPLDYLTFRNISIHKAH